MSSLKSQSRNKTSLVVTPSSCSSRNDRSAGEVELIMERFKEAMPHPRCELYYETGYQLLVSVVLSAQTTDKAVNRCMKELHRAGLTPQQVVDMGVDRFREQISSIGLAPTKAKHVLALSRIIIEDHDGEVPRRREELMALPGVGRKTANVILAELFGEPTLAVDTHVMRVGRRLGLHCASSPDSAEKMLMNCIPIRYLPQAHHWLILHGRYVCKARRPQCQSCYLSDVCPSAGSDGD